LHHHTAPCHPNRELPPGPCQPLKLDWLALTMQVLGCGLNVPSPDLLTPSKAAAAIWTWAPGHPYDPVTNEGVEVGRWLRQ